MGNFMTFRLFLGSINLQRFLRKLCADQNHTYCIKKYYKPRIAGSRLTNSVFPYISFLQIARCSCMQPVLQTH